MTSAPEPPASTTNQTASPPHLPKPPTLEAPAQDRPAAAPRSKAKIVLPVLVAAALLVVGVRYLLTTYGRESTGRPLTRGGRKM